MIRLHRTELLPALLILFAVACSAAPEHTVAQPEDPAPLLARLEARPRPASFRVYAKAEVYAKDVVRKGKVLVAGAGADRLSFTAMSFSDDVMSSFTSADGRFSYWDRGSGTCYTGEACRENLQRFMPMPPELLLALFSGGLPQEPDCTPSALLIDGAHWLVSTCKASERRVKLGTASMLPRRLEQSGPGGAGKLIVQLGTWKTAGGFSYPRRIRSRSPREELLIEVREYEPDIKVGEALFLPACPPGSKTMELDCPEQTND